MIILRATENFLIMVKQLTIILKTLFTPLFNYSLWDLNIKNVIRLRLKYYNFKITNDEEIMNEGSLISCTTVVLFLAYNMFAQFLRYHLPPQLRSFIGFIALPTLSVKARSVLSERREGGAFVDNCLLLWVTFHITSIPKIRKKYATRNPQPATPPAYGPAISEI